MRTAIWCLYADPARRPCMLTVVKVLEGATPTEHILDFSFFMPPTQANSTEDLAMDSAPQEASIFIAGLLAHVHNAVTGQRMGSGSCNGLQRKNLSSPEIRDGEEGMGALKTLVQATRKKYYDLVRVMKLKTLV
ncbi:hypothetical protein RJ640_013375 [Escallonia rubra]|uniref:Uncharacterized protein n=1 Tax=Escallonia rubra TaxID=112253 RepID=A0AA88R8Z7_9ASTE|nr:hypothetical protein RJ640_013375 [Escallonia rubra]